MRCEHSHWNSHVHIWISVQLRAVNKPLLFICAIHNSNAISRVRPFVFSHSYFLHQLTFGLDLLASVWAMTITRQGAKVERPSDVVLLLADRPERTGGALPRRRLRPALQQRARACVRLATTRRDGGKADVVLLRTAPRSSAQGPVLAHRPRAQRHRRHDAAAQDALEGRLAGHLTEVLSVTHR